jgi:hypothetical protein
MARQTACRAWQVHLQNRFIEKDKITSRRPHVRDHRIRASLTAKEARQQVLVRRDELGVAELENLPVTLRRMSDSCGISTVEHVERRTALQAARRQSHSD